MFFLPQVPYASITIITVIHAVELALSIKLWYLERYEIILKNSLTQSLVPLGMSLKQKSKTKQKEFLTIMLHLASLFFLQLTLFYLIMQIILAHMNYLFCLLKRYINYFT